MLRPLSKVTFPSLTYTSNPSTTGAITQHDRPLAFIDMGDRVQINGVQFSPDLTSIVGVTNDYVGRSFMRRAISASIANSSTIDMGWAHGDIMHQWHGGTMRTWVFDDKGNRITHKGTMGSVGYDYQVVKYNPTEFTLHTSQFAGNSMMNFGMYEFSDEIHMVSSDVPIGGSTCVVSRWKKDWTYLGQFSVYGGMGTGSSGAPYWTGGIIPAPDGYLVVNHPIRQNQQSAWIGVNRTTVYSVPAKYPTTTQSNYTRPAYVVKEPGKFWIVELPHNQAHRAIRYVTTSSVTLADCTSVLCTGDMSPIQNFSYPTGSGFSTEIDLRITAEKITINSKSYLIVVLSAFLMTAGTYAPQSRLIAYEIDANTPSNLTLVSTLDVNRAFTTLIDGSTIYMGRSGSTDKIVFNGSSFTLVDTFGVTSDMLFKTEAGFVIGVNSAINEAYNLSSGSQVIVDCTFAAASMALTGSSVTANVSLNVTDGTGVRIVRDVDLYAGGCKFSDGTVTKRVTTSATSTTLVPVTITSPGAVTVVPKLVS